VGFDAWHTTLISAVTSLSTALGVLWRAYVKQGRDHDRTVARMQAKLDDLHADHVDDVKTLTRETIELARAATYAPPLSRSVLPPPDSEDSSNET
jgi:hypothetical protein